MRDLLSVLTVTVVGSLLALSPTVARAEAPDQSICDGLSGKARGLCIAGVSIGCGDDLPAENAACEIIEAEFEEETGVPPPWIEPTCPCWTQDEIDSLRYPDPSNSNEYAVCYAGGSFPLEWGVSIADYNLDGNYFNYLAHATLFPVAAGLACRGRDCIENPNGGACVVAWEHYAEGISQQEFDSCKEQILQAAYDRGIVCTSP